MYLISYDIADDKLRKKVADELLNCGRRVQYSVFECHINHARYKKLYERLVELTKDMDEGSIRCYIIDKASEQRISIIGTEKRDVIQGLLPEEEILFI